MKTTITTPIRSKLTHVTGLLACAAASAACVADADPTAEGPEPVGEATQAIGEAGCAGLAPDATYTGFVPDSYRSPATYDSGACNQALAIQINNYSPEHVGAGNAGNLGGTDVVWADALPTTQIACELAMVQADLYRWLFGKTWVRIASRQSHGTWHSVFGVGYCEGPGVHYGAGDSPALLVGGAGYKIVATARTGTDGDTRRFRVFSTKDEWIE